MRVWKAICCAAALTILLAPGARADEWNKKTFLTFSGPVQVPGVTLPAGTYTFKLADLQGNRHVVQIFDKEEKHIYATILAIPDQRLDPSDKPVVLFAERAAGVPQAVKAWFYPGETIGNEFVYPRSQAVMIAKAVKEPVLTMSEEASATTTNETSTQAERMEAMKGTTIGRVNETGEIANEEANNQPAATTTAKTSAETTTAPSAPAATTPAPEPSSSASAEAPSTVGTAGRTSRRHLPRTASPLALYALFSGLSLAGSFGARKLR